MVDLDGEDLPLTTGDATFEMAGDTATVVEADAAVD